MSQGVRRVFQRGLDVGFLELRIVLDDLFIRPSVRQQIQDKVHADAGPLDDRLTHQHPGVYLDPSLPFLFHGPLRVSGLFKRW